MVVTSSKFGSLTISEDLSVNYFKEKPVGQLGWVNGGFFVLEKSVIAVSLG